MTQKIKRLSDYGETETRLSPEAKTKIIAQRNPDYLTPKQQAFVEHYLISQNGKHAAILAGYSESCAAVQACELLKLPKIKKRIEKKKMEVAERLAIDADWIVSRLREEATTAESDATRVRALELLGKVVGIYAPDEKKTTLTVTSEQFLSSLDLSEDDEDTAR